MINGSLEAMVPAGAPATMDPAGAGGRRPVDLGIRAEPAAEASFARTARRSAPVDGGAPGEAAMRFLVAHATASPMPGAAVMVRAVVAATGFAPFDAVVAAVGSRVAARWAVLQLVGSGEIALGAHGPLSGGVVVRAARAGDRS